MREQSECVETESGGGDNTITKNGALKNAFNYKNRHYRTPQNPQHTHIIKRIYKKKTLYIYKVSFFCQKVSITLHNFIS